MTKTILAFIGGVVVCLYFMGLIGAGNFVLAYGPNVECKP